MKRMCVCSPKVGYSDARGTGVAEALGNWGFSNEVVSPGHEYKRIQCLIDRMAALKDPPKCCGSKGSSSSSKICPRPQFNCVVNKKPGPRRVRTCYPLITYNSVDERIPISDKFTIRRDNMHPVYGRSYFLQRRDEWYKLGPLCCAQPSCPAPSCPPTVPYYCCTGYCCT